MLEKRRYWLRRVEEIKKEEFLSGHEQAEEIGVTYLTYKKIIDPVIPTLSLRILKKVRDYIEMKDEE